MFGILDSISWLINDMLGISAWISELMTNCVFGARSDMLDISDWISWLTRSDMLGISDWISWLMRSDMLGISDWISWLHDEERYTG